MIDVVEVTVILHELVHAVVTSVTLDGLHQRRHSFTSKQKTAFVSGVGRLQTEYSSDVLNLSMIDKKTVY